ncbi:unnamed protein product [Soboliphyme baturini]|uniref:EF-hand_like domain-containing protein n=1 Tax=Soboliphyme baturini TaxID=241478 RepID=A0A183JAB2_9BILA|nr:unnamed protein product [Soboliphyme baturini]
MAELPPFLKSKYTYLFERFYGKQFSDDSLRSFPHNNQCFVSSDTNKNSVVTHSDFLDLAEVSERLRFRHLLFILRQRPLALLISAPCFCNYFFSIAFFCCLI